MGFVYPMIQGVQYGLFSTEIKRLEDSVRAGRNAYMGAVLQLAQGAKALNFAEKATAAANLPFCSWRGKAAICLTPPLLAIVKGTNFLPKQVREAIHPALLFVQDHFSDLCQVANVVSTIALLYFGQLYFAIPSLLILGIGFLDRQGCLPLFIRQFLHRYAHPILMVTGIASGNLLDRIFAVLNGLAWGANRYLAKEKKWVEEKSLPQGGLKEQTARRFLAGDLSLQINPKYIRYNPFPPVPKIDIETLVHQLDQVDWKRHLSALRQKLKNDPRFVESHRDPGLKSDQEIIAIVKGSMSAFIHSVKEQRVLKGEPADYKKMHNYLKIIAKYVQIESDEMARTDALFRLAVEGGEYCGPGKFEVAESLYAQTIGHDPCIPFRDKVLHCLQDERNAWMQRCYFEIVNQNKAMTRFGKLIDWADVHNYNLFLNLFGDELGLRKAAADNDDTAVIDDLTKWVVARTSREQVLALFWKTHNPSRQVETLLESIGTTRLPKPDFYIFWQNWIERQSIADGEKEALREEIAEARLFGEPMEVDGKVQSDFVALMLLEMGILTTEG